MKKINFFIIVFLAVISSLNISAQNFALDFVDNGYSTKNTVTVNGINVNGNTSLSVEAWCNMTSFREKAPILFKENNYNCYLKYAAFYLFISSSGEPGFGIGNGTDYFEAVSNTSLDLNEWYHIAATWDGAIIKVYVNGIEVASALAGGTMWDEGVEMNIGNRWECLRRSYDGIIDDVRIWDDARTELEINDNMNFELRNPNLEEDLIAYYNFNEGSGNVANDLGPNSFNGQLGDYVFGTFITDAPTWVISTAPVGDCFNVDLGEDQLVYFGYNPMACADLTAFAIDGIPPYSYLWSTGETSESINVCPEESTVYTVVVTDAAQCSVTKDVLVEVEDVRCGWNNNKVLICHTSFWNPNIQYTLCVRFWLANILLYFGDEVGSCDSYKSAMILDDMPDFETIDEIRLFDEELHNENIKSSDLSGIYKSELVVYPNPIAGSANIQFEVSQNQQTTVEIISSLGQVVETLYSGVSEINKVYSLEFNAQNFNKGIYFVRLVNGTDISMKKISVVR